MVGTTRSQGGVLVVVLILKPWEGVDEGNKRDSIWELVRK
jgi:hypothetical protein